MCLSRGVPGLKCRRRRMGARESLEWDARNWHWMLLEAKSKGDRSCSCFSYMEIPAGPVLSTSVCLLGTKSKKARLRSETSSGVGETGSLPGAEDRVRRCPGT